MLAENPKAAGTIAVTFTIAKEGNVSAAKGEGALPDAMVKCVSREFYALSFPETDGRAVVVVVPIKFMP